MPNDSPQFIASQYLAELRNPINPLTPQAIAHYCQQAISLIFEYFETTQMPLPEATEILCEINNLQDLTLSRIGLESLFPSLIEQINDTFDPAFSDLYDRLFAQVISYYRQLTEGTDLDKLLNDFGLYNEDLLLLRKRSLTKNLTSFTSTRPLQKLIFLSRVTIGADIAITSVMISHLKKVFPSTEIVIIGPSKLTQLYSGDDRIRISSIEYERNANLLSRLLSWRNVVNAVNNEIVGLTDHEFYVFDPDSRLTQLGILPLLSPQHETLSYFLFESRKYSHPKFEKLGQLTAQWLKDITRLADDPLPFVSLPQNIKAIGQELPRLFNSNLNHLIACLSFGVGGNLSKRVSLGFEKEIANHLARSHKLFVDCGSTELEQSQANLLLSSLESHGKTILRLSENSLSINRYSSDRNIDVIAWQGGIGSFASLISASDCYLGYDSAGQHIAAALDVPSFTVFVNSSSQTFAKRWQPHGRSNIQVLQLDSSHALADELIAKRVIQILSSSF